MLTRFATVALSSKATAPFPAPASARRAAALTGESAFRFHIYADIGADAIPEAVSG